MELSANQTKLAAALPGGNDPPATPAQLAEATGLGYSTVTRLLRELAEAGVAAKDGTGWRATAPAAPPDRHDADTGRPDPDDLAADVGDSTVPDAATGPDNADTSADGPTEASAADAHTGPDATEAADEPTGPGTAPTSGGTPGTDPDSPDGGGADTTTPPTGRDTAPRQRLRKGELPQQILAALRQRRGEAISPHHLTKLIGARSAGAVGNACDALAKAGSVELVTDKPRTYRATPTD